MNRLIPILMGATMLLGGACALHASEGAPSATAADILATQQDLRARLQHPEGELARLDEAAMTRIRAAQDRVFGLLDSGRSLEELDGAEREELAQALSEIAAASSLPESNRNCRQRRTGSRLGGRC